MQFLMVEKTHLPLVSVIQWNYLNKKMFHFIVPKGVAHGYLTLEDDSVVLYHVSTDYSKEKTRGISVYDPNIKIDWSIKPKIISNIDLSWPPL